MSRLVFFLFIGFSFPCYSLDLLQAWEKMLISDPQYLASQSNVKVEQEGVEVAKAKLLPNINFSGSASRNDQDYKSLDNSLASQTRQYNAERYTLSLTQTLFRLDRFYALEQAKISSTAADQNLKKDIPSNG